MIQLDGSYGEGGGQILRTALACSLLTGKGFTLSNIRKGRKNPGLQAQHLNCVKAASQLCANSIVEGAELHSQTLRFVPGKFEPKNITLDIGTAGSVTLLLQSLLPALIVGKKKVTLTLTGGTDVPWSMPYDYLKEVFLPQLIRYADIKLELIRRGYYPAGGGQLKLTITPKYTLETRTTAEPYTLLDPGRLVHIKGVSHASASLQHATVAERQASAAQIALKAIDVPVNITTEYVASTSPGSGITLYAIFALKKDEIDMLHPIRVGADALGAQGKPSEDVGLEAARELRRNINSKAPVDKHLADNLIPYLALFGGKLHVQDITDHTKTNIFVVEQFFGKLFIIDQESNLISTTTQA